MRKFAVRFIGGHTEYLYAKDLVDAEDYCGARTDCDYIESVDEV